MSQYAYRRQAVNELVPGMILGKTLITDDGKVFLNEGAELTLRTIQNLQLWGYRQIEIREEILPEHIPDQATEASQSEQHISNNTDGAETPLPDEAGLPPRFLAYYEAAVQILKQGLGRVRFLKDSFEVTDIKQMVNECVMPLIEDASVLDHLEIIPHSEDYLYHHSVDVGMLSGMLGLWLGRPFGEIEEIILAGLLHDIGKAMVPLKILNKPGTLTDEEMSQVKFHSMRGYKFLKQNSELPYGVLLGVLQHHERMDGSGYPLAVKSDKIHLNAKIIAVADVFNAMTAPKAYGRRSTPYEAAEVMRHEMVGKLDVEICSIFLEKLCQRFLGNVVQLTDGSRGEVVFVNHFDSTRPVVRTPEGEFIDLDKRRDLHISKILHS